jgi:signal transduction histidine kinase
MAEVAIGVLHNIGNVLNSVNISVTLVDQMLRSSQSKAKNLAKLAELLDDEASDLGRAARKDPRGRQVVDYLRKYARQSELERDEVLAELDSLIRSIDHIKQIVSSQQALAHSASLIETFDLIELTNEAVRINQTQLEAHRIEIVRHFEPMPVLLADKHLLLQVLVNLMSNAIRAVAEHDSALRAIEITIAADPDHPERVVWQIADTGVGIVAENLTRIFESGFTTRTTGQGGFGLHSSALSADRMAGSLRVFSDGVGKGARFVLGLPRRASEPTTELASVAS